MQHLSPTSTCSNTFRESLSNQKQNYLHLSPFYLWKGFQWNWMLSYGLFFYLFLNFLSYLFYCSFLFWGGYQIRFDFIWEAWFVNDTMMKICDMASMWLLTSRCQKHYLIYHLLRVNLVRGLQFVKKFMFTCARSM